MTISCPDNNDQYIFFSFHMQSKLFPQPLDLFRNASVNSSYTQRLPPPPGYCGAFARPVSPGCGAFANCTARGPGICQTRGFTQAFDTYAVSCQKITTQRILLEKQAYWLICPGQEQIEEGCKGMFSILCMNFFVAYIESNLC